MKLSVLVLCLLVLAGAGPRVSAQDVDVRRSIELAGEGRLEEAKKDLPRLLAVHPDDPGVIYLQALTTADASEAVKKYQLIVDDHPRSEWADDALYRIAQFYQALGLVRTATLKMAQLRKDYPSSEHLTGGEAALAARPSPAAAAPASSSGTAAGSPSKPPPARATPSMSPAPARAGIAGSRPFALQVGAFSSEANAAKVRRLFADAGYPVEIIRRTGGSRPMYLVWVGRYASEEEARAQIARIRQQQQISSMVVTR